MSEVLDRCLFVVGRQRSGTTVTRKTLCGHPEIVDLGEIMHPQRKRGFLQELAIRVSEDVIHLQPRMWFPSLVATIEKLTQNHSPEKIFLVDIKYNMALSLGVQFLDAQIRSNFFLELERTGASILHIVRKRKVELIVSELVALETQQWQLVAGEEKRSAKIWLDPYTIGMRVREEEAQDEFVRQQIVRHERRLELIYEDVFGGGIFDDQTLRRVVKMMGLNNEFDMMPPLQKQGQSMLDTIQNYGQVEDAIKMLIEQGYLSQSHRLDIC